MFLELIKREFQTFIFRQPKVLLFLFGAPLAYMLIFGFLYLEDVVKYVPTVIYDQDQTPLSRALIEAFADSERFKIVGQVTSQEEMETMLRAKEARTAVTIPPHFAQDVKRGLSTQVLVTADNTNMILGNTVMMAAQEITQDFSSRMGTKLLEEFDQLPWQAEHKVAPLELKLYVWNNPTLSYLNFFLAGLVLTALQAGILLSMGYSLTNEFDPGHSQAVKEFSTGRLLLGKCMVYFLMALISYSLAITATIFLFGIPFKGTVADLAMVGIAFVFAVTAMGTILGAFCKDETSYTQATLGIAMPAFIFSGYTWPLHAMNGFGLMLSYIFPVTYTIDVVRDILLAGYSPLVYRSFLNLLLCGLLFAALGIYFYDRKRKLTYEYEKTSNIPKTEDG